MKIRFKAEFWKAIMQKAGGFITPVDDGKHKALNYIRLICEGDFCTAIASEYNGYTYCSLRVPCKMEDKYSRADFFVRPEKVPAKLEAVDLEAPQSVKEGYKLVIGYHFSDCRFQEAVQEIPDVGTVPNFEWHLSRLINEQEQQYFISFRLDVLQMALSAFKGEKDCHLVFHFGTHVQPAIIEAYDSGDYPETKVAVCPNRVFSFDGRIKK